MQSVVGLRAARPARRLLTRFSSTHAAHIEGSHGEEAVNYPKEGFFSPAWAGIVVFAAGVVAFYKYAPAQGEDNFITRSITRYSTPTDVWAKINFHHLLLSQEASEQQKLIRSAKLPVVHRYRYPQMIDQGSPHSQPLGSGVDLSDLVVKRHE